MTGPRVGVEVPVVLGFPRVVAVLTADLLANIQPAGVWIDGSKRWDTPSAFGVLTVGAHAHF